MHRVTLLLLLGIGALASPTAPILTVAAQTMADPCLPDAPDRLNFRFCADSGGWVGGFADLPALELDGDFYGLSFRRAPVPLPDPDSGLKGLRLSGDNHSDDLFMYVKRQLTGLAPNARYRVRLRFTLYTNVGEGCFGIGGSPGESVYVKAGAARFEPRAIENEDGDLVMNLDKGNQAQGGRHAVVVGDLAAAGADCLGLVFVPKRFGPRDLLARTDRDGNLWAVIGTDSGFEGRTTVYISHIRLGLRRL